MKAVYYCRVSTDEENQLNALADQTLEAKNCISSMGWMLADGYVDEGKSGTSTKNRKEYNRLFEDLSSDKYDVIVVKSQDRLMRNTKEWYVFIDALVANKKKMYFYLENKFYTPDDALLTGIKAILAEEYSRDLSKKIRSAHRNRQEKGQSVLLTSATWGYDKIGKNVVVNEREAEIVRLIFDLCIQGYGGRIISKKLSERGIYSRTGGHFPEITIRRIIRNPLFKGTAVMNKRTTDFNTKRTIINPEDKWRIHEAAVPPIVSAEIWDEANRIMDGRLHYRKGQMTEGKAIGKSNGKYILSGKVFCGECGKAYWRKCRRQGKNKGEIVAERVCSEYIKRGKSGCSNAHIKESDLIKLLSEMAGGMITINKQLIIEHTMRILGEVLSKESLEGRKRENTKREINIIRQKELLLNKLLDGTISDKDYIAKDIELEKQMTEIEANKAEAKKDERTEGGTSERINDLTAFLWGADFGELQVSKLIKQITEIVVFRDRIEFCFDSQYADTNKYLTAIDD